MPQDPNCGRRIALVGMDFTHQVQDTHLIGLNLQGLFEVQQTGILIALAKVGEAQIGQNIEPIGSQFRSFLEQPYRLIQIVGLRLSRQPAFAGLRPECSATADLQGPD